MRRISRIAVLGSGIMGTGIACHFANAGYQVLLLDLAADGPNRNARADDALKQAQKAKPASLFVNRFAERIETGNFDDDLQKVSETDWIIEAVIENLDIKRDLFERIEKYRKEGTIISSNTSGIPIRFMTQGRSDDFRAHFLGTHFFNPPRYLELLEIIPGEDTTAEVMDFVKTFARVHLGKTTVICKDTPAFIANRIGVFAMTKIISETDRLGLSLTAVDKLTGTAIGRPATGTFRLADLVGIDSAAKVIAGIKQNCPDDEQIQNLKLPDYFDHLLTNNYVGNKSGRGFYYKTGEKDASGRSVIHSFNSKSLEYEPTQKPKLESIGLAKQIDNLRNRIKALYSYEDEGGELLRQTFNALFAYASNRIPEISNDIHTIDNALKAGFAWKFGPFEYWDIIGVQDAVDLCEADGYLVAKWVKEMLASGHDSFYKNIEGTRHYYDVTSASYQPMEEIRSFIILDQYRDKKPIFKNDELTVHDIGDQVLCAEFRTKSNAIGEGILRGINEAISIAEDGDWQGLVIGNNATNFTVGANLMLIGMMAFQKQFDELDMAVRLFQDTTLRCRTSQIPVVAATQGYVFGGGCETIMHCDSAVCSAESYIGLVEVGIGVIPGGGGTKEFAVRASDNFGKDEVHIPELIDRLRNIALANVATSAHMAIDYGYLNDKDEIVMHRMENIGRAKTKVLNMAESYVATPERHDIMVLGRTGLGALYAAINELKLGGYATDHDILIAKKLAYVLCGGDLTGAQAVSERYLLNLEREAFLSLCGEDKTLARIQHMLEKNKPLRN